jgi:hypothetical protein
MGNNEEIRKRMETYRKILLAVVWIIGIVGIMAGLVMIIYKTSSGRFSISYSYPLRPYGIPILIVSILESIIGHFLVNVGLAVPFILLNNGDNLESMTKNAASNDNSSASNISGRTIVGNKLQKKCKSCKKEVDEDYSACPYCGNNTFE